jgi:hypothetical protein
MMMAKSDLEYWAETLDPKGIPDVKLVIALEDAAHDRDLNAGFPRKYQAYDVAVKKYRAELIDRLRTRR